MRANLLIERWEINIVIFVVFWEHGPYIIVSEPLKSSTVRRRVQSRVRSGIVEIQEQVTDVWMTLLPCLRIHICVKMEGFPCNWMNIRIASFIISQRFFLCFTDGTLHSRTNVAASFFLFTSVLGWTVEQEVRSEGHEIIRERLVHNITRSFEANSSTFFSGNVVRCYWGRIMRIIIRKKKRPLVIVDVSDEGRF